MIFLDELSFRACLKVTSIYISNYKEFKTNKIRVLDPIHANLRTYTLSAFLRLVGIKVQETEFFTGDLRTETGENLWMAARNALVPISYKVAKKTIDKSKALTLLNKQWKRNTILLFLAKYFFRSAGYGGHHTIFKIMIADALSREQRNKKHYLVLG